MVAEVPGHTPEAVVVTVAEGNSYTPIDNTWVVEHAPFVAVTLISEVSVTFAVTDCPVVALKVGLPPTLLQV